MTAFSSDQLILLQRVLGRMKNMNMKPTAFNLALALRANDMPPEDLGQVREWLAAHSQDEPEPEDPRGKQFTTKFVAAVSNPNVDENKKEIPNMSGNMQPNVQAQAQMNKNWMDIDDEHSSGDYISFLSGVPKILKIVTEPIAGNITFKKRDGSTETNFGLTMTVLDGDNPEIKEWSVTSKQIRDQLKAIVRRYGFPNGEIAGAIFKVVANGEGLQRKYWVELVQKPGAGQAAQPRPEPIPVTEADREASFQARQKATQPAPQAVPGQEWIESQKQGMAAPGVR